MFNPPLLTLDVYKVTSRSTTLAYGVVFGTATSLTIVGDSIYMKFLVYGDPNLCLQIMQRIAIN